MNKYTMRIGVQWVLANCTSYQVAKDLGINNRTVNRYQNGESPVENMTLATAEKLYNYYIEEVKKMNRDELFSRALANLNQIGIRRFEKNKPTVESKYLSGLGLKPMTTFTRAHKDVMQYAAFFDEVDLALIDQVTNYIGSLDTNSYTDTPLADRYLHYYSSENVSLLKSLENEKGAE